MIGGHEVDFARGECLPEVLAISGGADGRGAFVKGAAVGDGFRSEIQIMRAGFDGDGETFGAGLAQIGEGLRGGEMNDVERKAVFTAKADEEADGGQLGLVGTRAEPGGVTARVRALGGDGVSGAVKRLGELGVDEQGQTGAGEVGQCGAELRFVDTSEAVQAGLSEKALEAASSGSGQRGQMQGIVGGDASPGSPVDAALALGRPALGIESGDGGGGGQAVERHVDEGGETPGGGGAGGGRKALPFRAAGLVDVEVGIDEAWEQRAGAVDEAISGGDGVGGAERFNSAITDQDSAGADLLWRDDGCGDEGDGVDANLLLRLEPFSVVT
jgi:hypothetical protein